MFTRQLFGSIPYSHSALVFSKSLIFYELRGDNKKAFLHCAEEETASLASTFTMPLLFKASSRGLAIGEWAEDDNLFARTSRNLVTH